MKNFFSVLVCILFMTACTEVLPRGPEEQACQKLPRGPRFDCFTKLALEKDSPHTCDFIVDGGYRIHCKTQIALRRCNPNVCSNIIEDWKRDGCREKTLAKIERGECD